MKSNSFLLSEVTWDWGILEVNESKWHRFHTEKYSYVMYMLVLLSWSGTCTIFLVLQVTWQVMAALPIPKCCSQWFKVLKKYKRGEARRHKSSPQCLVPHPPIPRAAATTTALLSPAPRLDTCSSTSCCPLAAISSPSALLHPSPVASQPLGGDCCFFCCLLSRC